MSSQTQSTVYTPAELERHEHFERMKQRKSRWYCTLCTRPDQTPAHFDCRGATKHEASQRHQENLARINHPPVWLDLNAWADVPPSAWDKLPLPAQPARRKRRKKSKTPFEDLRTAEFAEILECQDPARRMWRIRMWVKAAVLADGGEWVETEADIEPPMPEPWWNHDDDKDRPELAWALSITSPSQLLNEGEVETATEDQVMAVSEIRPPEGQHIDIDVGTCYSEPHPWVEKLAEKKGWDDAALRDRNYFYTLPNKAKVEIILRIIREQSPEYQARTTRNAHPQGANRSKSQQNSRLRRRR